MPLCYDSLPGQLLALLQAGRTVTVRWDCGSDDHLVAILLDGVEQAGNLGVDYHQWLFAKPEAYEAYLWRLTDLPVLLSGFLAERLRLPSVGEFHMQGGGIITLEDNAIMLEFQSDAFSWSDELEPADWSPEYFLSAAELAELFPERVGIELGAPGPIISHPDLQMSADYSGREALFTLPLSPTPSQEPLRAQVYALLQAGHTLGVRWDCGHEGGMLFVDLNGTELPLDYSQATTDLAVRFSDYLLRLLKLPLAGSFRLRGGGQVVRQGASLVLAYQSEYFDYEGDWLSKLNNEQLTLLATQPPTSEVLSILLDVELSAKYTGRQVLFASIS